MNEDANAEAGSTVIAVEKTETTASTAENIKNAKSKALLDDRFEISFDSPISEYSNDFAQAYEAIDNKGRRKNIYAISIEKFIPSRNRVIEALMKVQIKNMITPIARGAILNSATGEMCNTIILARPAGMSLADYITKHGKLNESFIKDVVVSGVNAALTVLKQENIAHGSINADNIYIDEENHITVGDCVSEPIGYSQPYYYETVERAVASRLGKGDGDCSIDYYALGVLTALMIRGIAVIEEDELTYNAMRLKNGTFNSLILNTSLKQSLMDICMGLLIDKKSSRWNHLHISDWLKGKKFNLVRVPSEIESSRSLMFNKKQYFNRKSLAQDLFLNWNEAKDFLREEKIVKWIEGSIGDKDNAERVRLAIKTTTKSTIDTKFDNDDELVARVILILDPDGPIRIKKESYSMDSLDKVLSLGVYKNNKEIMFTIIYILRHNLLDYFNDNNFGDHVPYVMKVKKKLSELAQKPGLCFGVERLLYSLCPELPCQSPLLKDVYVTDINQILTRLNKIVNETEEYIIDRHVASFIGSKINLAQEIKVKELNRFPSFSNNKHITTLALLAAAQKESQHKKLPELGHKIYNYLEILTEDMHNKHIVEDFKIKMQKVSNEGNLTLLQKIIIDPQFIYRDHMGFIKARRDFAKLEEQIRHLKNKKSMTNIGYKYGLQFAAILSYFLVAIILTVLISKAKG